MRTMTNSSNCLNLADKNLQKTTTPVLFPSILWLCKKSDHTVLGHQNCNTSENLHRFGYHYAEAVRSHFKVCTLWNTIQWYRFWQSKKCINLNITYDKVKGGSRKKKEKKCFLQNKNQLFRLVLFLSRKTKPAHIFLIFLFQCFNDHSLQCLWCDLEMERKLILFDEMGVKSVPDCVYSGRCYKMLLASITLELQGLKKRKKKTPKRLLLFHTGHVLVVCRIGFLSQKIHVYLLLFSHSLIYIHVRTKRFSDNCCEADSPDYIYPNTLTFTSL